MKIKNLKMGVAVNAMLLIVLVITPAQTANEQTKPELYVETMHTSNVAALTVSFDGQLLATAGWDGTVKLWDVASARELRTWRAFTKSQSLLRFSPSGTLLAISRGDNKIIIVDVNNEKSVGIQTVDRNDAQQDRANKQTIRTVLELLSDKGRTAVQSNAYPMLRPATPDDVVVLYIASHGYADPKGKFYVVPSDIGEPAGVSEVVLDRCLTNAEQSPACEGGKDFLRHSISSDELTQWLQAVDAGQMVLILDSCHSAAVSGPNFKPGPMGDRSFGQLSYDKGMLVLAATQAENLAWGNLELGDRSILTDALMNQAGQLQKEPFNLRQWLSLAQKQVPELFKRLVKAPQANANSPIEQEPAFFDFAKTHFAKK